MPRRTAFHVRNGKKKTGGVIVAPPNVGNETAAAAPKRHNHSCRERAVASLARNPSSNTIAPKGVGTTRDSISSFCRLGRAIVVFIVRGEPRPLTTRRNTTELDVSPVNGEAHAAHFSMAGLRNRTQSNTDDETG